jgi:hypothetical protein
LVCIGTEISSRSQARKHIQRILLDFLAAIVTSHSSSGQTKICRTCRRSFVALTELVPEQPRLLKTPKPRLVLSKSANLVSSPQKPQTLSGLLKIRKPRLVSSKSAKILSSLQDESDGGALIFFGFVLCLSLSWRVFLRTGRHPGWWSKSPKVPRRTDDFMCVGEKKIERENRNHGLMHFCCS